MKKTIIIATELYSGGEKRENQQIELSGTTIQEVKKATGKAEISGYVTPAFIDAHSHIGMDREGEPWQEGETNDHIDQLNPLINPLNSIYFDDRAFTDAVDFGVLYSCVVPGSGNLIGGQAKIIRNFASHRDEALFKDYGYKMALGFNPRSTTDWKGTRPNTRMGVYALLENAFDTVLQKEKKAALQRGKKIRELSRKLDKGEITEQEYTLDESQINAEYELGFTPHETALLDLLSGTKTIKVHVHKDDDVLYLIELVKKYNLKVTADHTADVFNQRIFEALRDAGIPVVYGPLGSVGYKVELKHGYYQNTKLLMNSGVRFGLMTDHPVIHSLTLRDELKYFQVMGMSDEDALNLITLKNAEILGIDDQLGTIQPGKLASLIVWDRHPLHIGATPVAIFAEGTRVR